jgi:thioredoxin-related protein
MKKLQIVFGLLFVPVFLMAQGIQFEKSNFATALNKAKNEKKVLFIDGYAVWCGPCKRMDQEVFPLKEVGDYFAQNLVALKVDVERGEGPEIKRKYGINGLPGYVFLDGDGNVVYRESGSMPAPNFLKAAQTAVAFSKDPLCIGRLALRYDTEKNDESFLKLYLDKLKESNSANYVDVLDQYLKIQKSIAPSSKEMIQMLFDHQNELVFGGEADRIIRENFGTEAWKQYVRKDIREMFQKLPQRMTERTTNYAIDKKDSTILELTLERAKENGIKVDAEQRKRTYTYFYLMTGMGEQYKKAMYGDTEKLIESLDVENLRAAYLNFLEKQKNGGGPAYKVIPHAVRFSNMLQFTINTYARYAVTDAEKQTVKKWAEVAYRLTPGEPISINVYSDVLYLCGEKAKAIELKEEAMKRADEEGVKKTANMELNYAHMKAGEKVEF